MGPQYPCRDCSFNPSIRILTSVNLSFLLADFNLLPPAIWIVPGVAPLHIVQGQPLAPDWSNMLTITGLAISMVVNALVMSLIILRVFKVFREVKTTSDEQILGPKAGGSTLRPIIFVLIESGMLLFSIQLVRLVTGILACWTDNVGADYAYPLIPGIHGMLNVSIRSDIFYIFILLTIHIRA